MSKAETLGASSEFSRARTARSSPRRQTIDGNFGGDPTELKTELISYNPDNPRENIGDVSGLADTLCEIGLVNPITVASVDAYTRDRPDRAAELEPGAEYVVVDGHRRLAAARHAGLPTIKVHVDDALVSSDEGLLEAAFVANAQRENMSELDEAQALEKLVKFYGSQGKAAKRLGVSQGYISQRLSLLKLSPELQADLDAGRRKVEQVRNLAGKSPEQQRAVADERREQARLAAEVKKQRSREPAASGPPTHYDVMTTPVDPEETQTHYVVMGRGAAAQPEGTLAAAPAAAVPHQEAPRAGDALAAPRTMPWHDPRKVLEIARLKMTEEAFAEFVSLVRAADTPRTAAGG